MSRYQTPKKPTPDDVLRPEEAAPLILGRDPTLAIDTITNIGVTGQVAPFIPPPRFTDGVSPALDSPRDAPNLPSVTRPIQFVTPHTCSPSPYGAPISRFNLSRPHDKLACASFNLSRPHDKLARARFNLSRPHDKLARARFNLSRPHDKLARARYNSSRLHDKLARARFNSSRPHDKLARARFNLSRPHDKLPCAHSNLSGPHD